MPEMIAVDPGDDTGWARFSIDSAIPLEIGEVKIPEFMFWLASHDPDIWVVEDYIIRPPDRKVGGHNHFWNKGDTLRLIGAVQFKAHLTQSKFVKQQASIKPLAYAQMGMTYVKGKKGMHIPDAVAHGGYYLGKTYGVHRPNLAT